MHLFENWYEEKRSAYLYHIIAAHEPNPKRKILFMELADMANKQAILWEKELEKKVVPSPKVLHPIFEQD